jgi:hypothetical protein
MADTRRNFLGGFGLAVLGAVGLLLPNKVRAGPFRRRCSPCYPGPVVFSPPVFVDHPPVFVHHPSFQIGTDIAVGFPGSSLTQFGMLNGMFWIWGITGATVANMNLSIVNSVPPPPTAPTSDPNARLSTNLLAPPLWAYQVTNVASPTTFQLYITYEKPAGTPAPHPFVSPQITVTNLS